MGDKKPYVAILVIQLIYTGLYVISKAALDEGLSTFTFIFYRQLAATTLLVPLAIIFERRTTSRLSFCLSLKIFMHALIGLNIYNVGLKYTSATVASAATNSIPVITFFLALIMRMETLKLKSLTGISKILGVGVCMAGIITMALYSGPHLNPLIKHHSLSHKNNADYSSSHSKKNWIKGTFFLITANSAWSLWIVLQGWLLKEYPSKLLFTAIESVFSAVQSFLVAVAFERDMSRWKLRLDMGLVAIAYCGFIVTGGSFYMQSWCIDKKGPVFLAMSTPLSLAFTIICSSLYLGEVISLGSVLGGILMVGGLYSVLWSKSKEGECRSSDESTKECDGNKEVASTVQNLI
ncbi:WAT1-related protein At5g64700-like isoform X2 [Phalaenopsis equestris]|uniref:WAT1-related protein At5g64700-like isoform X2 n=1 Tax=Phalaenopsis equestris TaxID=78828 RepID=UPI0009E5B727|nr:WAT1-related protein At5g64700-like isoform X2 [Phalaenopsis equestris]